MEVIFQHEYSPDNKYNINLSINYESYETGHLYYSFYDTENILKLHKIFHLDPCIIEKIIDDNFKVYTYLDFINLEYNFEIFSKKYKVLIPVNKVNKSDCTNDCNCYDNKNQIRLLKKELQLMKKDLLKKCSLQFFQQN